MAKLHVLAALLLMTLAPASGSLLESESGGAVAYQADAGTEHDAPDTCAEVLASPEAFDLPEGGAVDGLLVAGEDEFDYYRVAIPQERVGTRVTIFTIAQEGTLPFSTDVFVPGCGSSVIAEENQPEVADHPAPADGQRQVSANVTEPEPVEPCVDHDLDNDTHDHNPHQGKRGNGHYKDRDGDDCAGFVDPCADPWAFELSGFTAESAPVTIHAVWTDGSEQDVVLAGFASGVATYRTTDHLEFTLHSATANVPEAWDGTFNVTRFSCDAEEGSAVFGDASSATPHSVSFTPIENGTFVLVVQRTDATVPTSMTLSCHFACAGLPEEGEEFIGYEANFPAPAA